MHRLFNEDLENLKANEPVDLTKFQIS